MGILNAQTSRKQATLLSKVSMLNPRWLDKGPDLHCWYKVIFSYLGEILFSSELIKICSTQYLISCNRKMKWPKSSHMTCIHGIGSVVVDYDIFNIPLYNKMINLNILKYYEPNSNNRTLIVTLNIFHD